MNVAQFIAQQKASSGGTPAAPAQPKMSVAQFIQQQQNAPAPSPTPAPASSGNRFMPGGSGTGNSTIDAMSANAKAGKNPLVDAVTSSEQGFGSDIASAMRTPAAPQSSDPNYFKTIVGLQQKAKAAGQDTTHYDTLIANYQKNYKPAGTPDLPSTGKVLTDAAGVALDAAVPGGAEAGAKIVGLDAASQAAKKSASIVSDLSPKLTAKETEAAAKTLGTSKTGILGKVKLNVDPYLKKVASTVEKYVPNFADMKTIGEKLNATKNSIGVVADELKQKVISSGKDIVFPFKQLAAKMDSVEKPIAIKADSVLEKQFDLAKDAAMKIVQKNGGTISSLLDSRKEFDQLVEKQFPNLYDKENAPMRSAITAMRNTMNDFIADSLPDVDFKDSLKVQSQLYTAVDNLASKVGEEINTNVLQRAGKAIADHPVMSGAGAAVLYGEAKKIPVVGGYLP